MPRPHLNFTSTHLHIRDISQHVLLPWIRLDQDGMEESGIIENPFIVLKAFYNLKYKYYSVFLTETKLTFFCVNIFDIVQIGLNPFIVLQRVP